MGLGAGDQAAAHQELLGAVGSDQNGPHHGAAVAGHQADLDVGVAELGGFRDHADVAEQGQRGAQADRVAIDGADDGLADFQDVLEHAARGGRHLQRETPAFLSAPAAGHALDVAASGEELARTREDDHVDQLVLGQVEPHALELGVHFGVDRVAVLGLVERECRDAVLALDG